MSLIPGIDLVAGAWRVPFWLGGLLVIVGLIARLRMPTESTPKERVPRVPLLAAIKRQPKQMLLAIGVSYGYNTIAYIGTIFAITYAVQKGYTSTESLIFQLVGAAVFTAAAP